MNHFPDRKIENTDIPLGRRDAESAEGAETQKAQRAQRAQRHRGAVVQKRRGADGAEA